MTPTMKDRAILAGLLLGVFVLWLWFLMELSAR